ncbi:MAG: hypothetical protein AB1445_08210 [Bacillota bacterium]
MKRSFLHLLVSLGAAVLTLRALSTYLKVLGLGLPLSGIVVFVAVRLVGALVDSVLLPAPPIIFYEDLARELLLYAFLGLVASAAIAATGRAIGIRVDPAGPALVLHIYALMLPRLRR